MNCLDGMPQRLLRAVMRRLRFIWDVADMEGGTRSAARSCTPGKWRAPSSSRFVNPMPGHSESLVLSRVCNPLRDSQSLSTVS